MSGYIQSNQAILLPDADYTVSAVDTGKLLFIPEVNNNRDITLPPVQIGLHYRFLVKVLAGTTLGNDVRIAPIDGSTMNGLLITQGVSAITLAGAIVNGAPNVTFDSTAVVGDYIDLYCDGTLWHVSGMSQIAGGIL